MSFLPGLHTAKSLESVENVAFYGLNRNANAGDGYFANTKNMTSFDFPFLSSRKQRYMTRFPEGMRCIGTLSAKKLCFVLNDGEKSYFYYGGEVKGSWDDAEAKEKLLCEVGGAIYIYPDKKFYRMKNEIAIEEYKASHSKYGMTGSATMILTKGIYHSGNRFTLLYDDGGAELQTGDYIKIWAYDKATDEKIRYYDIPLEETVKFQDEGAIGESFANVYFLFESNFDESALYKTRTTGSGTGTIIGFEISYPSEYGEAFGSFGGKESGYEIHKDDEGYQYLLLSRKLETLEPESSNFEEEFLKYNYEQGMTVFFSTSLTGVAPVEANILETGIKKFKRGSSNILYAPYLKFAPDTFTISDWTNNEYAILYDDDDNKARISVMSNYPSLEGVVCVNNRLWGYEGNRIHASSLGKPYIMTGFSGISTDSWTLETGIKRNFTGVANYSSMPHFFTEDGVIKVYGSEPSSFKTAETVCAGVKEGSDKSIALCAGVLYYLDKDGFMASYTGSYPTVISRNLNRQYSSAICTADDRFLYCVLSADGIAELYVFDTHTGVWLLESEKEIKAAVYHKGTVYFFSENSAEHDDDTSIADFERYIEEDFESMLEMPVTDEGIFNKKKLKKILFKINAKHGTSLLAEARETDSPYYRRIFETKVLGGDEVLTIPVDCKRTLGYTVRITGKGEWRLEGIMRKVSAGSYKA